MTTIAHNRTIILIGLLSQLPENPKVNKAGHPNSPHNTYNFVIIILKKI